MYDSKAIQKAFTLSSKTHERLSAPEDADFFTERNVQ